MIKKLLHLTGLAPETAVVTVFLTMMVTMISFSPQHSPWAHLAFLPVALFVEELSRSPRVAGYVVAKNDLVTGGILVVVLGGAATWMLSNSAQPPAEAVALKASFVVLGGVVGAILSQCFTSLAVGRVLGRKTFGLNLAAVALWTIALLLFPVEPHGFAAPWYIAGIAVGLMVVKVSSLRISQQAAAQRRLAQVSDSFRNAPEVSSLEYEALQLLARGRDFPSKRFKRLRSRIDQWTSQGELSPRLRLISACAYRFEGAFEAAVEATDDLRVVLPTTVEEANLGLIRALSLEELGKEEEADEILYQLIGSEAANACPIASSTYARRLAEKVLRDPKSAKFSKGALEAAWAAMERRFKVVRMHKGPKLGNREQAQRRQAELMEASIPVTISSTLDMTGYCHLAAGLHDEARLFLRQCVETDPDYSYGYLHLGDSFLFRDLFFKRRAKRSRKAFWHAEACYYAAYFVEGNKDSRVRRLAKARLQQIQQLSTGGESEPEVQPTMPSAAPETTS